MTHPAPDQERLLTVEEAAECLGIGRTKTHELVRRGLLAPSTIGARQLIAASSVAAYIHDQLWHEACPGRLTKEDLEALVEAGDVQSITLRNHLFVSVDSLDSYLQRQLERPAHADSRREGTDQCHR